MTGVEAVSKAGGSEEFFGTREYRQGDSLRYIHWPSTARHSQLIVKEFEIRAATEVTLILDLHKGSDIGAGKETTLEYAVKIAASISQYSLQKGHAVQLACYGEREHVLPASQGLNHMAAILEELAKVRANGSIAYPRAMRRASELLKDGGAAVLIFSPVGVDRAEFHYSYNRLRAKRIRTICVLLNEDSFRDTPKKLPNRNDQLVQELSEEGVPVYYVSRGDNLQEVFAR